MKKLEEIYKGQIPNDDYQVLLSNGEEFGAVINLKSKEYTVNIEFGNVSAIRMLDEGIILKDIFQFDSNIDHNNFSNIIYKIHDNDFEKYVKEISNELFEELNLTNYLIVTMNYVIEVITSWEPSMEILKNTVKKIS